MQTLTSLSPLRTTCMELEARTCSSCKRKLPISEFALSGGEKRHSRCKTCVANEAKQRYHFRKNNHLCVRCGRKVATGHLCKRCLDFDVEKAKEKRGKNKRLAIEYLGGKCRRCGLVTLIYTIYDFHHKDEKSKEYQIAKYLGSRNWARLKRELDKCTLLCANCHRAIHWEENHIA